MESTRTSARTQRLNVGSPPGVLLVIESPPLLLRMAEVVRSIDGVRLAGSFSTAEQAVDWLVWERAPWHFAFVDLGLRAGATEDLVQRLLAQPRPGTVVAIVDHLWRELRERCAAMGVADLLEKGDVIAFRGYLEARAR